MHLGKRDITNQISDRHHSKRALAEAQFLHQNKRSPFIGLITRNVSIIYSNRLLVNRVQF